MKEHLAFLRTYKEALRVKLNAAEDLLVNGQREPTDRGVCRHLLGKVDRTVIERAVEREPYRSDVAARARLLAGAIRVTADLSVLLSYLETLAHVRSRAEAAAAFAEVVRRIDFAALAPSKLARLLQVLVDTFAGAERVQVLFSLLAVPGFCGAFDAAEAGFPAAVAEVCAPLRAVHRRLQRDAGDGAPPAVLAAGVELVLDAPDAVLHAYAEPLRIVLLELALGSGVPAALADRAVRVLLPSLARTGRPYARLALRRAAQCLRAHADDRARAVLDELRRAQPDHRTAQRWLAALDAKRLGRVALVGDGAAAGRLLPAFWLDGQRAVWLRTAPAADAGRLAAEARLHARLALPGVATLVEHGVAGGTPYVAVTGSGRPLGAAADAPPVVLVAAAGRVLRAVALAGVRLPDAAAARFLADGASLVLADLDGATAATPDDAAAAHATHLAHLARALAPGGLAALVDATGEKPPPDTLDALVAALDRAALLAPGR